MKTIVISGASGLLASEIIRRLLETEENIRIFALSGSKEKLNFLYGSIPQIVVYSWDEIETIPFHEVTCMIHCAFARVESGAELHRSLTLTKDLLKKAGENRIAVVSISSRSVYGQNPELPWNESSNVEPNGLYAMAKVGQELLTEQAAAAYGFSYTNVRLAGLMGVGMDARLISKLVQHAVQTGKLNLVGGEQQFALLDIRDAAAGILAITGIPSERWKPVYNLGHFEKYTLSEMANIIKQVAYRKYSMHVSITKQPKEISLLDGMDCSVLYQDTGWRPSYHLSDTVCTLFEHYMSSAH